MKFIIIEKVDRGSYIFIPFNKKIQPKCYYVKIMNDIEKLLWVKEMLFEHKQKHPEFIYNGLESSLYVENFFTISAIWFDQSIHTNIIKSIELGDVVNITHKEMRNFFCNRYNKKNPKLLIKDYYEK